MFWKAKVLAAVQSKGVTSGNPRSEKARPSAPSVPIGHGGDGAHVPALLGAARSSCGTRFGTARHPPPEIRHT